MRLLISIGIIIASLGMIVYMVITDYASTGLLLMLIVFLGIGISDLLKGINKKSTY